MTDISDRAIHMAASTAQFMTAIMDAICYSGLTLDVIARRIGQPEDWLRHRLVNPSMLDLRSIADIMTGCGCAPHFNAHPAQWIEHHIIRRNPYPGV